MPACDHSAFDATVAIEATELGHLATIEIRCRQCEQPMRFVGLETGLDHREPTCSADGTAARLPMVPAHDSAEHLRCPDCERLLYGQSLDDGPGLERQVAVVGIECGTEHVVRFADHVALVVGCDGVRVLDHDGDTD